MKKKHISIGLINIVLLQNFTLFTEYFLSINIFYILIVLVLITYNIFGLMLQKTLSECIAIILLMACCLLLNEDLLTLGFVSFHNTIINDFSTFIAKFLICFFSSFYFLLISTSLKEQKLTSFEYLLIILFAILGLLLMCCSNDFMIAYLSLELSSLAFYILASFKKTSSYSIESGLKYFITGAVSSAFFLLGISFIYIFSGSIYFDDFKTLYETNAFYDVELANENEVYRIVVLHPNLTFLRLLFFYYDLRATQSGKLSLESILDTIFDFSFGEIGLALITCSLCIKLAAAPFHLWSLDVFEGSPSSSSFFFAAISKLAIFVLLIRICFINLHSTFIYWQSYMLWIGLFSVFIGSLGGLKQRKLKTLLAYSSITNVGYGLLALGLSDSLGIQMLFFHLIIYMISSLCAWSILIFLRLKTKKVSNKFNKELCDLALLRKTNSTITFAFSLTMFSLAGIPPMVGFLAKMGIFLSVMSKSFFVLAAAAAVFSVIAAFFYIRVVKIIYFENLLMGKLYYPINSSNIILLSFLVFLLILLFVNPSILYLVSFKFIPKNFFAVY